MLRGDPTENILKAYFESRGGWKVSKLDLGNNVESSDFRICSDTGGCFLYEVKTIKSGQANFAEASTYDYFFSEREDRRKMYKDWLRKNKGKRLILSL